RLRLALLPTIDAVLEHPRSIEPAARPKSGEREQKDDQNGRPAATGTGISKRHARCEARGMRRFKGTIFIEYPEGCGAMDRLIGERLALPRNHHGREFRPGARRPLGVRLRIADLAAGIRLS